MSLQVTGQLTIFKGQYGYSTSIAKKNQNDEYEYMRLDVSLPKGAQLENKTKINVTNGFLSFYTTKEGLPKVKVVILNYKDNYEQKERKAIQNEETAVDYTFEDLPF